MGEVLNVFISANTADPRAVRGAARHALLTLGCFPVEQEHFGPARRENRRQHGPSRTALVRRFTPGA